MVLFCGLMRKGVDSISVPLREIRKFDCELSLLLEPNRIYSVLPRCNDNLLSTSHSLTTSSSF